MTTAPPHRLLTTRTGVRLGWIVVVLVSAFVALAGLYVLAVPVDPDFFASTTGMAWADFEARSPSVAPSMERSGRLAGVASSSFGLFGLVVALTRLRRGDPWAARTLWILPLGLAAYTLLFVLDGVAMLAAFYGALALAAAGGLVLASREMAAARAREGGERPTEAAGED
jgi:hypothetical protein